MPAATKKPRVWKPRPSAAARERILEAVRTLTLHPGSGGWVGGFGVRLKVLTEVLGRHPTDPLSPSTLKNYVRSLVADRYLRLARHGVYALPVETARAR